MIVHLSQHQWRTVSPVLPELHRDTMAEHAVRSGRSRKAYTLPAIGWRQVLDILVANSFGPLGGKLDRIPKSRYTAIKNIAAAVMAIEGHPALREGSVLGHTGVVVPAWSDRLTLSPYPPGVLKDTRFVLMWPIHLEANGHPVTAWEPRQPPSDTEELTYREDFHLLFGRHVVGGVDR